MKTFIVYTRDNCGWCSKAKNQIRSYGHSYQEIDVGKDISLNDFLEFVDKHNTKPTVPKIVVDDQFIGGYEDLVEYFEDHQGGFGEGGLA